MPSRKNSGRQQSTKSARADKMARKRDERVARDAYRKQQQMENYLADDENFSSFASQMSKMGLQLRDIPGDGNCLFRALGDQMQGHGRNHQKFRSEVTKYMLEHRADFEPFVEDDVPFERHVSNLKKIGTYAGNDAIVAFARLHGVNVVIHQLNSPMWTIKGTEKPGGPELHISYHNGDHYSSVRRTTDNTETPACITIKKGSPSGSTSTVKTMPKPGNYGGATSYNDVSLSSSVSGLTSSLSYAEDSDYDNLGPEDYPQHKHNAHAAASGVARVYRDTNDVIEQVMEQSGCMDRKLVQQTLEKYSYDVDSSLVALHMLIQSTATATSGCSSSVSSHYTPDSGVWSRASTPTSIFGGPDIGAAPMHTPASVHMPAGDSKSKISSREHKEQAKREKKLRAMERHRSRLCEDRGEITSDDQAVEVTHGMGVLQI